MEIDKRFQRRTLLLKSLLTDIKERCDANETLVDIKDRIAYIKSIKKDYYPLINKLFLELTEISSDFDNKAFELHKKFIRENLYLLMADPTTQVNRQIGEKPLGYAGDYVVANFFYEDGYSGTSLYGMFMDRYTLDSPLARAHINRRTYLGRFIEKKAKLLPGGTLHVCSFACGPAPEVFDTFEKGINNVRFTLIDAEPGVIEFLKSRLGKFKEQKKYVDIHHANIINLLRRNARLHIPEQDIIYCAGFFDYIRDTTATKCIRYMLSHLRSKGWLVVVNVSMDDVKNVYLKMLGEWDLYHRTKEELLSLVANEKGLCQKKVWSDYYTKRNLYLVIKKA